MLRFSISIIPPTSESKFSQFSDQILAILKANSQICQIFYQQYLLFKTNAYFLYFHHLSNIINTHILHQHYLPQRQKLRFSISTIPTHLEQQILTFFISNILIFKDKYSERQIFRFCHIFNQYYSLFQNNFKQMPTFCVYITHFIQLNK